MGARAGEEDLALSGAMRNAELELGRSMRCSAELVNKAPSDSVIDRAKQRFVDNKHATKATLRQRQVK